MVTGAVAQNVSLLARITLYNKKGHRIRDVLKFNSATRIRTWKMLESESSALPFGDSPLLSTDDIILQQFEKSKHFFKKITKSYLYAMNTKNLRIKINGNRKSR